MPATMCCSYKTSRRGLLLMTMLTFLFAIVFIGVGAVSARFGASFVGEANEYCQEMCLLEDMEDHPVGCNCDWNPPGTELPTIFFMSPAIGMIVVGVFTFFTSILGCLGAIRERNLMLSGYICALLLVIILQFGFGVAAATVATGNSEQVQGPLNGVLQKNYKLWDWKQMEIFFPEACYAGSKAELVGDPADNKTYTYHFPLCRFNGGCLFNDPDEPVGSPLYLMQNQCCDDSRMCLNNRETCMSGEKCIVSFLARVGAPIAVVAFLALIIEISALVFACIIRTGTPERKYSDRA
uniref:Tetraspanin n=1 Tax=Hemiselmis andersenii TaxID=464988 RepID=A0A6T8HIP6_HEMAN|mmetsp:Transcript_18234/g.42205  ORF Transcript_18234/g.42205 Transcript_18234/m.42205 type:complete len:295 (+) Transcript_18234:63-947(+)